MNTPRGGAVLNMAKTHCPKGHPYVGDNLIIRKTGKRQCKACTKEAARAKDKRNRLVLARIRARHV